MGVLQIQSTSREDKEEKVDVKVPAMVQSYNKHMKGTDRLENNSVCIQEEES